MHVPLESKASWRSIEDPQMDLILIGFPQRLNLTPRDPHLSFLRTSSAHLSVNCIMVRRIALAGNPS